METSFSQTDVMDVAWSPHDAWLASCSVDNTVVIWNAVKFPGESSKDVPACKALCQSSLLGCISLTFQISRREWVVSFEVPHLQSGRSVLPGVVGNEQGVPHCCKQLHSGCAADFTWKSWLHVFIYMPFILSWLPILIAELSDFEADCAPSQPLLPQADKQECDWK